MPSPGVSAPGQPEVRITSGSGSISVIAEPRSDVVADRAVIESGPDGAVSVLPRTRSASITIRCPLGTHVVAGTRSGSVNMQGRVGEVRATTLSGGIVVDEAGAADLRAMSGSIVVGACSGRCRAKTKSGSVRIGSAGSAEVTIGSGSIAIDQVSASVRVRAVSGSVRIGAEGAGPIDIETMSGSITVTLPRTCRPDVRARSLSSRPRVEMPAGRDCEVVARTLSGSIVIRST